MAAHTDLSNSRDNEKHLVKVVDVASKGSETIAVAIQI